MTRPILVCMSWRGGQRLMRCLASIEPALEYFSRVIISVTSDDDSQDMAEALRFKELHPSIEVICTHRELPTMEHQAFWVHYLQETGATRDDWVYWLAYDDEVRVSGLQALTDEAKQWPLEPGTAYFGPWAMRHEKPDQLWNGDPVDPLEVWTSFPSSGPTRLTVAQWVSDQLRQPTYMQMSGSVTQLGGFIDLRDVRPRKKGPMRIEMAIAAATANAYVEEFLEPVSIIYGRSNSDRASYGKAARSEDMHLIGWLARHSVAHPEQAGTAAGGVMAAVTQAVSAAVGRGSLPSEEWRVRGQIKP